MPENKKKKVEKEKEVKEEQEVKEEKGKKETKKEQEVKEEQKKTKETIDNEAKPGKDDLPKAVQDPNEDKPKPEPKPTPEPEMNKVVKDKVVDKTDDKEPRGDFIDPHIQSLEKDIKKTMDIVSELESMFATSVDAEKFNEINDFIDNFDNLKEEPEDEEIPEEIPEDIPEVDEVEDEDEVDVTATGDDEIEVDTGEEDTTQAVVTVDMPSDVEPEDVNVGVEVDKKNQNLEIEPPEDELNGELPEDMEPDNSENLEDEDFDVDEDELLDHLNKFVNNILNEEVEDNNDNDDNKEKDIKEEDEIEKEKENLDDLIENLNKFLFDEKQDDTIRAVENFISYLDNLINEETQMEKAKKNVEEKFEDPNAKDKETKEKKEETLKENVQSAKDFELLPIAENAPWSAIVANKRILENVVREDTTIDFDMLKKAYLYVEEGNENDIDAYRYQIADVINGELYAIPTAINKMTELFSNDLTLRSLRVKEEIVNEVRAKLEKYLEKMGEEIPWNSNEENGGSIKFQEANGLLSIYTAYEQFDPSKIISKLQEKEDKR